MNRYAVIVSQFRALSVYADSVEEAKEKAHRQLDKPGRRGIYRRWKEHGEKVEEINE
jgi:hypothetical protein